MPAEFFCFVRESPEDELELRMAGSIPPGGQAAMALITEHVRGLFVGCSAQDDSVDVMALPKKETAEFVEGPVKPEPDDIPVPVAQLGEGDVSRFRFSEGGAYVLTIVRHAEKQSAIFN